LERHLEEELARLAARKRLREPIELSPDVVVMCSNDYLGYGAEPPPIDAMAPGGAGASRLVSGDHPTHRAAERAIADWLRREDALLFSSGYAANVGAIGALCGAGDLIVSDALNHASIIDGARLSRARVEVVPHLDLEAVDRALESAARRRWVITESYFSMDATSPDLSALRAICDAQGAAMIVDEAHAVGVFGEAGRGLCSQAAVEPDVLVGTLGKALGLQGAFVVGSRALRRYLWNNARSFVFSTGMSPSLASAVPARVAAVAGDQTARHRLERMASKVREDLAAAGVAVAPSHGPIVPLIVGDDAEAVALRDRLLGQGIFVQAIRPPTVPEGTARLRITLHARLRDDDLARLVAALARR
jgi:8-amino-7-oxononanoate synthase